jgi:hypothetical protein
VTEPPAPIQHDPRYEESLDAYVAGRLAPDQQAAFEKRLSEDASLRAEVELRRKVRASLARLFPYPEQAGAASVRDTATLRFSVRRVLRIAGIAAATVMLAAAGYIAHLLLRPVGPKIRSPESLYTQYEQAGWKPAWVCHTDQEFVDAVARFLGARGTGILISLQTPGIEVLGWSFADQGRDGTPLSERTLALLTRVEGRPVLVLMDLLERDRTIRVRQRDLHLYRREVDGFVLYEVSPLAEPRVIPKATTAPTSKAKTHGSPGPTDTGCGDG